jgi:uncharacterized FAD-dependent dehydrogenase
MALCLREVGLRLGEEKRLLPEKVARALSIPVAEILSWKIIRMGIDARRKPEVLRVFTIEFVVADEASLLTRQQGNPALVAVGRPPVGEIIRLSTRPKILVAGMGPAGLFSALTLAEAGAEVTLIERGRPVTERLRDVQRFWSGGPLNPESNIQFGEGGAGTFSDGKLTSRLNHPLMGQVLATLVRCGAPEEILWQAKPHVGSDRLRQVLLNFREQLLAKGVEIRFSSRLTGIESGGKGVSAGRINHEQLLPCDQLVLALGHSARDSYRMLWETGVALEAKPFAIGLRVEHPLELINRIQYGREKHPQLPAAEYSLAWNDRETGRGVYSFCMCPGGVVVNAASEEGGIVVNGMSNYRRDAQWSNAALVVSVRPEDFPHRQALAGIAFQRRWEEAAFQAGGGNWQAPAQPLLEFLGGKGALRRSSCQPQVAHAELRTCLPEFVVAGLGRALPNFDRRMRGFVGPEATLIGVETRTSAPLRILRDREGESVSHPGLFPVGEGAGYAGGIMSAAVDGIRAAQHILQRHR